MALMPIEVIRILGVLVSLVGALLLAKERRIWVGLVVVAGAILVLWADLLVQALQPRAFEVTVVSLKDDRPGHGSETQNAELKIILVDDRNNEATYDVPATTYDYKAPASLKLEPLPPLGQLKAIRVLRKRPEDDWQIASITVERIGGLSERYQADIDGTHKEGKFSSEIQARTFSLREAH